MASAFLSGINCQPNCIVEMASQEECQTAVGYTAKCARLIEAGNPVWVHNFASAGSKI